MRHPNPRQLAATTLLLIALSSGHAAAQTMQHAFSAAWERHPAARALGARQDEFAARRDAADSFLSAAPSATLSNRNDRLQRDTGQREWEAGIALPLWLPGYQARTLALIEREQSAYAALVEQARWKLAGEVREAWWQAMLAANEREVARSRAESARQLAGDVERRIRAGDLPRMDGNQARSAEAAAEAALAEADGRAHRAARGFLALTGLAALPSADGMSERRQQEAQGEHPQLAPLERAVAAARARLDIATKNVRDLPELTLGVRRERPLADAGWEGSTIVGVRIPLSTDTRNRPKIAAANAELIEAEALLPYEQSRVEAERETAVRELARAEEAFARAETRRTLTAEMRREYARAFALGNIDLPQRLRVEADAFDAELAAARARIEAARAVSRYNQAIGVLP
jgi:outer membrane protein, heavy metal efflux system